ncbi:helix-turn-helix transcriptional regulator [Bradyrhizobium liaoningense]|nr:winged helix-turn-helix transcriptional regulator [Bradyrhizobium liaoningense]MBR1168631.1 helix-turn-helix transcriptional regulator [Bradyrhizobium liaoningense]
MKSIAGKRIRGSRTGRPIMVLLDLLGRRMTLRILWELSNAEEPLIFRELQEKAETNPAVLNARLKELRAANLVSHTGDGYVLTTEGRSLCSHIRPLNAWAGRWAAATEL